MKKGFYDAFSQFLRGQEFPPQEVRDLYCLVMMAHNTYLDGAQFASKRTTQDIEEREEKTDD